LNTSRPQLEKSYRTYNVISKYWDAEWGVTRAQYSDDFETTLRKYNNITDGNGTSNPEVQAELNNSLREPLTA